MVKACKVEGHAKDDGTSLISDWEKRGSLILALIKWGKSFHYLDILG